MAAIKLFGKYKDRPVYLIKLTNGILETELLSFGATIRALRVVDKNGIMTDVCLGYDSVEEYASNDGYLDATVGRNANRISGSRFSLNDEIFNLIIDYSIHYCTTRLFYIHFIHHPFLLYYIT